MTLNHSIAGTQLFNKREAKRLFRDYIFCAWQNRCAYCGVENPSTLDHIKPRSKGGTTNTQNLIPACSSCNRSKASQEVFSWFRSHPKWTAKREADLLLWVNQPPLGVDADIPLLASPDDE